MNVLIVYSHAEPQSFNGALFRTAQETLRAAGHSVQTSDLYAMKFDPVSDRRNFTTVKNPDFFKQQIEEMHATEAGGFAPDVEAELRKLEACDLMIWQFPLWWFGVPGILKGWVDRVFAMGRTYGGERFYENGVFKGKRALLSLTTGGREPLTRKAGGTVTSTPSCAPSSAACCGSSASTCSRHISSIARSGSALRSAQRPSTPGRTACAALSTSNRSRWVNTENLSACCPLGG